MAGLVEGCREVEQASAVAVRAEVPAADPRVALAAQAVLPA